MVFPLGLAEGEWRDNCIRSVCVARMTCIWINGPVNVPVWSLVIRTDRIRVLWFGICSLRCGLTFPNSKAV